MARTDVVHIVILMLVILALALGSAEAGTEDEPEIWDEEEPTGDNGGGDIDIISAWFHDEDVDNQHATLLLHSLPPFQDETDTIEYEIYFSIRNYTYAVVATFEFATGFTDPDYTLRAVTYDNGTVTDEVDEGNIVGDYDTGDATITFILNKSAIGGDSGDMINHTWAGVWLTPSLGGDREISDWARTYNEPGWEHYLAGLTLSETLFEQNASIGDTVTFTATVMNVGDVNLTINVSNSYDENWNDYHAEKWDVTVSFAGRVLSPNFTHELLMNETTNLVIAIVVPSDTTSNAVIDGKDAILGTVKIDYWLFDLENVENIDVNYQVLVGTSGPGPGPDPGDDDDDDDDEFMFGLTTIQFAVVAVIVLVVLIVIIKAIV